VVADVPGQRLEILVLQGEPPELRVELVQAVPDFIDGPSLGLDQLVRVLGKGVGLKEEVDLVARIPVAGIVVRKARYAYEQRGMRSEGSVSTTQWSMNLGVCRETYRK